MRITLQGFAIFMIRTCVLYGKGKRIHFDETPAVAIVGTRRCSPYGKKVATTLGFPAGPPWDADHFGFGKGIDTVAMTGALRAGVPVVGVLGCGIDVVYPRENGEIYRNVAAAGTLLSEYPPGTRTTVRGAFSGAESDYERPFLWVVVVEGPMRSGSLITKRGTLEQERCVCRSGNIDSPLSLGPNRLLRDSAIPVYMPTTSLRSIFSNSPTKLQFSPETMKITPNRVEQGSVLAGINQGSTKKEVDRVGNERLY